MADQDFVERGNRLGKPISRKAGCPRSADKKPKASIMQTRGTINQEGLLVGGNQENWRMPRRFLLSKIRRVT